MRKIFAILLLLCASTVHAQMVNNGNPAQQVGTGLTSLVANDNSTGTTVNLLAKVTATGALKSTTSDTTIPVRIVVGGAGLAANGPAQFLVAGQGSCVMDASNASGAAGWYVIESVTTNGRCHAQASAPSGGWVVGTLVDDATTSGSNANVFATGYFNPGSGTGSVTSIATNSPLTGGTITTSGTLGCPTCVVSAAALTDIAIVLGSGGGQGTKTVAGLTTDGVSKINFGVAGSSVGGAVFANATSGSVTLQTVPGALGSVIASLPANTGTIAETNLAQTWSALQTFGTNISIGGVTASGATGTVNVVFSTSPTLTTPNLGTPSTLTLTNATGLPTAGLVANAVTSAKMAVVNTYRTCDIAVGDTSASAITNAQLGPQKKICFVPAASTVVEINVTADAGTPNVIVGRNRAGSTTNLLSSALATAASGAIACSNTGGTTGLDGATTCSSTLQNTSTNAGDFFELVSGTAGGTAKFFAAHIVYTVN